MSVVKNSAASTAFSPEKPGMSRRAMIHAGAWAVPVLTLAVATPAIADSSKSAAMTVSVVTPVILFVPSRTATISLSLSNITTGPVSVIFSKINPLLAAVAGQNETLVSLSGDAWHVSSNDNSWILTYTAATGAKATDATFVGGWTVQSPAVVGLKNVLLVTASSASGVATAQISTIGEAAGTVASAVPALPHR